MRVLVASSGAMGSSFGAMLHKHGHDVVLCDKWDENIKVTNEKGLTFTDIDNEEVLPLKMYRPEEVTGDFDLVILISKSMALVDMIESVKHLVHGDTKVLCLLNGLGHYHTLRQYFTDKQIIMGVTVVTAKLQGPGKFLLSSHSPTEVAAMDPAERPAVEKIIDAFNEATMPFKYSDDIMWSIWRKACINGASNAVCAIVDCNLKQEGEIPNSKKMVKQILTEFSVAAALEGVNIDADEMTEYVYWHLTPEFKGCNHYPSMHQDLVQNHRQTEVDYLNGYVARKLAEAGKWGPYNELITILVHGKEKTLGII